MSVQFRSTRAEAGSAPVRFREALFRGLAPDRGLYVPLSIPPLKDSWVNAGSFQELALDVLGNWLGDAELGPETFSRLVREALDIPVTLRPLSGERWLLELHHGPTLAFKDFAARFMGRIMNAALAQEGRRLTIVVATSGDTGSAVAAGFSGLPNVRVVLLYPAGRVSPLQERQLTVSRPGVQALRVHGDFDDCQRMAKDVLADAELQEQGLSSANSINIARLLPQQLYYLWSLLLLRREYGITAEPVFAVPSGNLGNLTAGVWAALSGAPVASFIAAHNANDWFVRWLADGEEAGAFPATVPTISNAMDVGAPSNFERLQAIEADTKRLVSGQSADEAATLKRIRLTWEEDGVAVCPHTAVGLEALERQRQAGAATGPAIVLATAAAAKFPEVVSRAVPGLWPTAPELDSLEDAVVSSTDLTADSAELKQYLLSRGADWADGSADVG